MRLLSAWITASMQETRDARRRSRVTRAATRHLVATIYKIAPASLWREAERAGAFTGAPVDLADGFIHFSTAAQVKETAARHFAGQSDLVLVAVDAAALGAALRYEPSRGGALFPHLYGTLPLSAVRWVKPLPLGPDGPCVSGAGRVIGLFDRLAAPLLRTLDPERAHALALNALKLAPLPRAAPDDEKLRVQAFGLTFPNPVGLAAGFDKNAEVPDQLFRLGFGFVEVGGVTPQPQPGNPRPRLFRLDADEGVINRLGLNSEGVGGGRGAARGARGRAGHRRHQHRRQQGHGRPHRRLRGVHRGAGAACDVSHRQRLVAEHAGPAQPAAGGRARRTARARDRCARARRERGAPAAAAEDRAGPDARPISTTWSASRAATASTA